MRLDISKKKISDVKVVVNGAGASAQACANLFKSSGVKNENIIMCDRKGLFTKEEKILINLSLPMLLKQN